MNTALPPNQNVSPMREANALPSREVAARSKLVELAPVQEPHLMPRKSLAQNSGGQRRHRGIIASFVLFVLAPLAVTLWYLAERAQDQFASSAAFAIRTEEPGGSLDFLSGFAAMTSSSSSDLDILNLFLTSQDLVAKVHAKVDLSEAWSQQHARDPVFTFNPDGTIEDLTRYWERMVHVDYDSGSGLIEFQVKAFTPEAARRISQTILAESTHLMNHLSDDAQQGMIKSATQEHELAKARLTEVRLAVSALRTRTGMVDPEMGLSGDNGVQQRLQESLADELVKLDLLRRNLGDGGDTARSTADVRISQNEIKIDVLRSRIANEREKFGANNGAGYSEIIAQFEELLVEQQFAEEAYMASTAALDVARAEARRSSRYLAVFVQPTHAERATYPQRITITVFVSVIALLIWALCVLVYYNIRDRRPV